MGRRSDEGATYILEAALASILVMAALYYVNTQAFGPAVDRADDLRIVSSDTLSVLEFRANSPDHPSLGFSLSSPAQWSESSASLDADIERMLPDGTHYYMETPYGAIGQRPAGGMRMYLMPFLACGDSGKMLDCRLIVWRA